MTRRRISAYQIAISDNWLVYLVRSGDKDLYPKQTKKKRENKLKDMQHHQQRGQQHKQAN